MARKDKNITPSVTQKLQELGYNVADWDDSQTPSRLTPEILSVLGTLSKEQNGLQGYPDRIYCNKKKKLLVLVEEKPTMQEHDLEDIKTGAVAGVKWYLAGFAKSLFKSWKILGIAASGDMSKEYHYKFSCYLIDKDFEIKFVPKVTNFLTEEQFLALFNNLDEEKAIEEVSRVSKRINNLLRSVDSQKRPILLSALMISLYQPKDTYNSFPHTYSEMSGKRILDNLYPTIEDVLTNEGIPSEKLNALKGEIASLKTDITLQTTNILKDILNDLNKTIIPLFESHFSTNSNYDIMGKFYEEFLRYAGVSNVKKGIVLTPRHITTLFTKLVPMKSDDVIVDLCCGTGAFLIAGMNRLVDLIENSDRGDKEEAIKHVKEKQLLGFELNATMYICAISNMLFRGDGKSSIYNYDSINDEKAARLLKKVKPTIGFINPPYSGKENKDDPTPKEITFLTTMLDNCSRYGVIIAPLSMYFKDVTIRDNILTKHTLKYVINMPKDLFQPNAMTHTAIAVFETNLPHDYKKEVIFYDLRDDGYILAKNRGRTDVYNKWKDIEQELLDALEPTSVPDDIVLVKTKIKKGDEWTVYAHSKTDYSSLSEGDFVKSVSDYLIFSAKKDMDMLDEETSEFELLEMLSSYYGGEEV
jgi:type I restriction-modification system DNA methylase subunit